MKFDYDIVIAGGGLAGNSLALALKDSGLKIAILESQSRTQLQQASLGDRALALSAGTVKLLEALRVWNAVQTQATPIQQIHVSDRGHWGKARLSSRDYRMDALGYVITARVLETYLAECVENAAIDVICPATLDLLSSDYDGVRLTVQKENGQSTITARLLVGADGGLSKVRQLLNIGQQQTDYQQTAIVTTVHCSEPHRFIAYERFTPSGPLALLPIAEQHCSVVWTRTREEAQTLMAIDETAFIQQLQQCFGYFAGELSLTAPRRAFPLTLIRAEQMQSGRVVIVGNAVHQLHPVAGQGFNLGMRDVAQLAEMLIKQLRMGDDIGDPMLLEQYARQRQKDHDKTIGFTDNLIKIFSNDLLPVSAPRSIGLAVLDHLPPAKSLLAKHAMGLSARLARIGHRL